MSNSAGIDKKVVKKTGLGRGLNSLLGGQMEEKTGGFASEGPRTQAPLPTATTQSGVLEIPVEKLSPNREQPRRKFKQEDLDELANSLKQKGIIQPILVRKTSEGAYQIIAGERRWRAAQLAGLSKVPVIIKSADPGETLELALIENIQRKDLNPIEEAEAYQLLIGKYHLTQQELADKIGKDRATVANILRLNKLHKELRELAMDGQLSLGQAKVLLSVEDLPTQRRLGKRAVKAGLSVRALEKLVARHASATGGVKELELETDSSQARMIKGLSLELQRALGTKVQIDFTGKRGRVSIDFYSVEELNRLVEKLR